VTAEVLTGPREWVFRGGWLALVMLVIGCGSDPPAPPLFVLLPPDSTGITFTNRLPESPELNILTYLNYYNGGGVAAGDVDGDGRPDLFFTANRGPNRLYRNLGGFRFEDITERAGVAGEGGWSSGVAMADVNGDGHLDLHVSNVDVRGTGGRNVLYLNDGDGTFTDRTAAYGLEHVGYSTQALFLDYDGDGDLDMYLLNHSVHEERGRGWGMLRERRHARAGDRLLRNDGDRFTDVSDAAGIRGGVEGYGLGVVASDLDLDGCIDLFVANDFQENDFLYRNDCDGTFTETIGTAMGHTSRSSMGVDAADFTNDGRPDLVVLDMMPWREEALKTSANDESFEVTEAKLRAGYHPQVARNTVQLNRGGGQFSEVALLAGVHATDWSWAPLFADLDNDGDKDLFVTNGIVRRPNDLDFIMAVSRREAQRALATGLTRETMEELLSVMPRVRIPNRAFRNDGALAFTEVAEAWGLAEPGYSNGAVYVDLDGDGALDLVTNDIDAPARVYRNRAREVNGYHALRIRLKGAGRNTAGIGARVVAHHGGTMQLLEQVPTRGFQSSVAPELHFGLGPADRVDSLVVVWPDGRFEMVRDLPADTLIELRQADAGGRWSPAGAPAPARLVDITEEVGLVVPHRENRFLDFRREPLMPHVLSAEGPALAVGDANGDGLDDLYVGGAKWQPGRLLLQTPGGAFRDAGVPAIEADSLHEDVDASFLDADGDGDLDLYVVSGGNEFWDTSDPLRDRLYRNDGAGAFTRDRHALPEAFENGGCVAAADFDGDGDVDLFVGARVVSRAYGKTPESRLLVNDGAGRFRDGTAELAPGLADAGMVAGAAWTDSDGDGELDLVVVGEWMPVRLFRQRDGRLVEATAAAGLGSTNGWWNDVVAADLNGDGRDDLVLGNLGLNAYPRASRDRPARLYVHDFSGDGLSEAVLTFYKEDGASYPMDGRDALLGQIPALRERYPTYASFGAATMEELFTGSELRRARTLEAYTFASAVAVNRGDGTFALEPLPTGAQLAPLYALLVDDFDGDGRADILAGGNLHGVRPMEGRYDATYGVLLEGSGDGTFEERDAGVAIEGQVRGLARVGLAGGRWGVAVARNDLPLVLLQAASSASGTGSPEELTGGRTEAP
jgi:hypothetical protein